MIVLLLHLADTAFIRLPARIKTKERSVEVTKTYELPRDVHEMIGAKISSETIKIKEKSVNNES